MAVEDGERGAKGGVCRSFSFKSSSLRVFRFVWGMVGLASVGVRGREERLFDSFRWDSGFAWLAGVVMAAGWLSTDSAPAGLGRRLRFEDSQFMFWWRAVSDHEDVRGVVGHQDVRVWVGHQDGSWAVRSVDGKESSRVGQATCCTKYTMGGRRIFRRVIGSARKVGVLRVSSTELFRRDLT